MTTFLGQYLHAIDDKGRVPLPAKFRNGNGSTSFVAVRGVGPCLYLYPDEAWGLVRERLTRLGRGGDREARRRMLAVTAQAAELALDKHGRLSLPQPLIEVAGLEHEALFVGAAETVQIWNPLRFAEFLRLDDLDYDQLAATVL